MIKLILMICLFKCMPFTVAQKIGFGTQNE